jgi:hypothetical protein
MITNISSVNTVSALSTTATTTASTDSAVFAQAMAAASASVSTQSNRSTDPTQLVSAEQSSAGKPSLKQFMDATGTDVSKASHYLNGILGNQPDTRNWSAIMGSSNPLSAANSANNALYFGANTPDRSEYNRISGTQPIPSSAIVAQSGNVAAITNSSGIMYQLIDNKGYAVGSPVYANDPQSLLKTMDTYGIDKSSLNGLADQLDAKGIKYKPYELYAGTGSDAGINLRDMAAGGLGTAYDWTKDKNAALKDSFLVGTGVENQASNAIAEAKAMAERLGVVKNSDVTTEKGIDLSSLAPQTAGNKTLNYVVGNSEVASWYNTADQAAMAQKSIGGQVIDLSGKASTVATNTATLASAPSTVINTTLDAMAGKLATASTSSSPVTNTTPVSTNEPATDTPSASNAPSVQVANLSQQLADLSSKLTSSGTTSMTSFMNNYNQLQALMAKMTDLQKTLAS